MKKNSRTKAPAFQFYAADWLTDPSLRLCSAETRGVWIDLLCFMFLSSEPGYLIVNGHFLDENWIQKFSNLNPKRFKKVFQELTSFGILKRDEHGRFYNKRMIEDERLRRMRRDVGKLGGNPKLKKKKNNLVNNLVEVLDNQTVNQNTTPSSSSSSSISLIKENIYKEKHFLIEFLDNNCPTVQKLPQPLNFNQAEKLIQEFNLEEIKEIFFSMENFKDIAKKYRSVFLTARNWLNKRKNDNNNNKPKSRIDFDSAIRQF